ncbi:hypothetical protein FBU59_005833 [Linderina macrospora]|uniref:Uncharacterized protein n=1 Tax=Linderina macrospora TaxID=4868 RepID=A0ACC1J1Q8_9FUNG|nr:hypothetical protein FBU59_005833 [Linderina macrospora]
MSSQEAHPERYLERYFSQSYYAAPIAAKRKHTDDVQDESEQSEDTEPIPREWQYVRMAPNKLCVIGIADEHPLLDRLKRAEIGQIASVEYADNVKGSVIKGKAKKNSLRIAPETKLCTITTTTGKSFVVRGAVRGLLMEWNTRLETDPGLIQRDPSQGFLAIIKPPTDDDTKILSACTASI